MRPTVFITSKTNGVFRSFDGGHMFAPSSVGLDSLTMGRAAKVTIDPTNTRVMYVGSEVHGGGAVYKSHDRGDHWSAANEGIEGIAVFALAMDPNEPSGFTLRVRRARTRRLRAASHLGTRMRR